MVRRPEVKVQTGQEGNSGYQAQSLALAEPEAYQPEQSSTSPSGTLPARYAYNFGLIRSAVEIALSDLDKGRSKDAASWLRWALAEVSR